MKVYIVAQVTTKPDEFVVEISKVFERYPDAFKWKNKLAQDNHHEVRILEYEVLKHVPLKEEPADAPKP